MSKFHRYNHEFPSHIQFKITEVNNTYYAVLDKISKTSNTDNDSKGAVVFVLAVVFLWGLSIALLIASHMRKRNVDVDNNVSLYLKSMQTVRKQSRKDKMLRLMQLIDRNTGGHVYSRQSSTGTAVESIDERSEYSNCSSPIFPKFSLPTNPLHSLVNSAYQVTPLHQSESRHTKIQLEIDNLAPSTSCTATSTNQSEISRIRTCRIKERHSYGCFLPEIHVLHDEEDDVNLQSDGSSLDRVELLEMSSVNSTVEEVSNHSQTIILVHDTEV